MSAVYRTSAAPEAVPEGFRTLTPEEDARYRAELRIRPVEGGQISLPPPKVPKTQHRCKTPGWWKFLPCGTWFECGTCGDLWKGLGGSTWVRWENNSATHTAISRRDFETLERWR